MTARTQIRLFSTAIHECSYLENQQAQTLFVDPTTVIDRAIYSQLSDRGFRRSGPHLYRPNCPNCMACIPTRLPVQRFEPNRSQRRILKKNADITTSWVSSIDTDEHSALYDSYIRLRPHDGDMFPPSREQYDAFLSAEWDVTGFMELRLDGQLKGLAVTDQLDQGLSAIYTFFDPQENARSLGILAILRQILWAQTECLPYLYMGYWIKDCQKMNYKTLYRPIELLIDGQWQELVD